MKKNKGFSLVEMMLVTGIILLISMWKFQDLENEQKLLQAKYVAQKIEQISIATNNYITLKYSELIKLESDDLILCNKDKFSCTISIETLKKEFLLPSSFNEKDKFIHSYEIELKREGVVPNFVINGLISTNEIKYNNKKDNIFLGNIISKIGMDGGFSKTDNLAQGFQGNWTEKNTDFSNIKVAGQLFSRVGYGSNLYSVYLRRDGTLPMTGDLNLNSHNINEVSNITVQNNIIGNQLKMNDKDGKNTLTIDGDHGHVNTKGSVHANILALNTNSYGDSLSLHIGSDSTTIRDYQLTLGSDKPLNIWYKDIKSNEHRLMNIQGSASVYGGLNVGYGDKGGYIGGIQSRGSIVSESDIKANGIMKAGGDIIATGNIKSENNISGKTLKAESVFNSGDLCSNNGSISHDPSGQILSCQNGKWQRQRFESIFTVKSPNDACGHVRYATAICPKDSVLVGGGYSLGDVFNRDPNKPGTNSPDGSYPTSDATGWHVVAGGYPDFCFWAYAICAR